MAEVSYLMRSSIKLVVNQRQTCDKLASTGGQPEIDFYHTVCLQTVVKIQNPKVREMLELLNYRALFHQTNVEH